MSGGEHWAERQNLLDAGIPEFRNLFYVEIEERALKEYRRSREAIQLGTIPALTRVNDCLHIAIHKIKTGVAERSVDVCLDKDRRRIFSRQEGHEGKSLELGLDSDRKVCALNEEGGPLTLPRTSEILLRDFLFGPR